MRRIEHLLPMLVTVTFIGVLVLTGLNLTVFRSDVDRIEELREQRVLDQAVTDRFICERQKEVFVRLRETKRIVLAGNATLVRLIEAVSATPSPDPEDGTDRRALLIAAGELRGGQAKLERGVDQLTRLLAIDCADLPSERPFER